VRDDTSLIALEVQQAVRPMVGRSQKSVRPAGVCGSYP